MTKKEARKAYHQKRMDLGGAERNRLDDLLLINFQKLALPYLSHILSFYPIIPKNEINTFIITDYLQFINPGLKVAYPCADFKNHTLQPVVSRQERFQRNLYDIYEPLDGKPVDAEDLDLVLVPLMVCDVNGNRVGYGKGFYDRFLAGCRPDCLRLGLSYFEPVDRIEDASELDVPLNFCITPQQVYAF